MSWDHQSQKLTLSPLSWNNSRGYLWAYTTFNYGSLHQCYWMCQLKWSHICLLSRRLRAQLPHYPIQSIWLDNDDEFIFLNFETIFPPLGGEMAVPEERREIVLNRSAFVSSKDNAYISYTYANMDWYSRITIHEHGDYIYNACLKHDRNIGSKDLTPHKWRLFEKFKPYKK